MSDLLRQVPDPPPTLLASAVRIDEGGVPSVDGLDLHTTSARALVLGSGRALFEACAGLRPFQSGTLAVLGEPPDGACELGLIAAAPTAPPLPPQESVEGYVTWSARLAGHPRDDARQLAGRALGMMGLTALAGTRLGRASLIARRATVIAAALATDATLILLDAPLEDVADDVAVSFARTIVDALGERDFIAFAPRAPLASPLTQAAEEALIIVDDAVVGQGDPAELASRARTYALRVAGNAHAFGEALRDRGIGVVEFGSTVTVELGRSTEPSELLSLALEHDAVIVGLRPVAYAFE